MARIAFLLLVSLLSFSSSVSLSFSPPDEYLLNCGSHIDSTVDNRRFIADASSSSSKFFSSEGSISLQGEDVVSPSLPQIYRTARVFARQAKYEFNVLEKGTYMVRLHFNRINSSKIDLNEAEFHVTVNGHVVLRNFNGNDDSSKVREFLIWVEVGKVVIRLVPSKDSKFAFVNTIEVISAPEDLIADVATSVSRDGTGKLNGLAKQAMEVMYRINVGGRKVTPFNDTLWRTWLPDDDLFKTVDGSSSDKAYFTGRIKYRPGGASREVGPDNVYNTARVAKGSNGLSWEFPVSTGYKYLVRMHFCDIASRSLGLLYFNVYINGNLAYEDFDISDSAGYVLASPYYIDFVVDPTTDSNNQASGSTIITVSVGPSNKTSVDEHGVGAMLNGVEIMKLNNSMGSLDGFVSTDMILTSCPNRRNLSIFIAMMAFMCIFMSFYVVAQRKKISDDFGWTKLSMDVREVNPKSGNQFAAIKP